MALLFPTRTPMTDNEYEQFTKGAEHPALAEFRALVQNLQLHQSMLADLEQRVKIQKEMIREISERQLPDLLDTIGLGDELPLANGTKLVIKRAHGASPLVENREAVWDWMETNGHGHLVKRAISVLFGTHETDRVALLHERLGDDFISYDVRKVESQTLSKFVRDADDSGIQIPEDLFGVYRTAKAQIKGTPKEVFPGEAGSKK